MKVEKLFVGFVSVVLIGCVVGLVAQHRAIVGLRESEAQVRKQLAEITREKNEMMQAAEASAKERARRRAERDPESASNRETLTVAPVAPEPPRLRSPAEV